MNKNYLTDTQSATIKILNIFAIISLVAGIVTLFASLITISFGIAFIGGLAGIFNYAIMKGMAYIVEFACLYININASNGISIETLKQQEKEEEINKKKTEEAYPQSLVIDNATGRQMLVVDEKMGRFVCVDSETKELIGYFSKAQIHDA